MADPVHIRGSGSMKRNRREITLRDLFTVPMAQQLIIDYVGARVILPGQQKAVRLDLALQGESESLESQAFVPMTFEGRFKFVNPNRTAVSFSASEPISIHFAPGATLAAVFERNTTGKRAFCSLDLWGRLENVRPRFTLAVGGDPLPIISGTDFRKKR